MDQYYNDDYGQHDQSFQNSDKSYQSLQNQSNNQQDNQQQEYNQLDYNSQDQQSDQQETRPQFNQNITILDQSIIHPSLKRITTPFLTKYQKALIIGIRATQISKGSPLYVNLQQKNLQSWSPIEIAENQLLQGAIPFIVRRTHPDGEYQDWKVNQLKMMQY